MSIRQDIEALLPSVDVAEEALSTSNRALIPAALGQAAASPFEVPNGPPCEVQSVGTNPSKKLVQNTPSGTKKEICTFAAALLETKRHRYKRRPGLKQSVIRLYAEGIPTSKICQKLKILKQLAYYYRKFAIDEHYIRQVGCRSLHTYERGPNYHLLEQQVRRGKVGGVRYSQFVPHLARVHAPRGSAIRFDSIKIGELHTVKTEAGMITLFPEDAKGNDYTTELPIPRSILGYDGGRATLHCYWGKEPFLAISPPEIRMGIRGLESTPPEAIFKGIIGYIMGLLEQGGWRFYSPPTVPTVLHYAFPMRGVDKGLPDLAETVPTLRVGDSEEELVLFQDWSHGTNELETTDYRMALDILALLEVSP